MPPTAIERTISGIRHDSPGGRLLVVLEPRSNTMKLGIHKDSLAAALVAADGIWVYRSADLDWDPAETLRSLNHVKIDGDIDSTDEETGHR